MSEDKIVYSAVAVPGEADSDGEILTPYEIRHAAHAYLRDYRIVDPEHVCALGECYNVGKPVESYLTTEDMSVKSYDGTMLEFPRGTWVIGIEITDNKTLEQIRKGEKQGVSLTAKRADGVTKSRVLIRDLGPDWVARTVSIVKNPAVPKARFFSIQNSRDNMNEEQNDVTKGFDRVIEAIKSLREPVTEEAKEEEEAAEVTEEQEEVDAVKTEETIETETSYVTHEELDAVKSEILEAIKTIQPPEAVKEEEDAEDEDEDEKDKRIKELEAEIQRLKTATKSKAIPDHFQTEQKEAVKNLYSDDGRDMYGRVIRD